MMSPADDPAAVGAIVLAAGRGERLGGRKLELPWSETTVLGATLASLVAAEIAPLVVVLGDEPDRLRPTVRGVGAAAVSNPCPDRGMLSSVWCGLDALPPVGGVLILPGDQPLIRPSTLRAVADAVASTDGLVIPLHDGRRGHPIGLAATLFPAVRGLDPRVGLRQLRALVPERVRWLDVPDSGILADLDTPEDYARWR